ncbi:MAG: hypothetical protein COA74_04010 [Gammaproteobacteria bacterium]|nr:MAG: hypothetical protein COA74_04010 [Gammaproteobacteria bacterium]
MFVKQYKIGVLAFLLSWVFAQYLVLHHELSEEHNQQTEAHFCITLISDKEDQITNSVNCFLVPNFENIKWFQVSTPVKIVSYYTFHARAPPILIS